MKGCKGQGTPGPPGHQEPDIERRCSLDKQPIQARKIKRRVQGGGGGGGNSNRRQEDRGRNSIITDRSRFGVDHM